MSAFIVSKDHIDVLVNALLEADLVAEAKADAVGKELWDENHRSVNYRYGESTATPDYVFTKADQPLDPSHVMAAAQCYDYQSCEHGGWELSTSWVWVCALDAVHAGVQASDKWEFTNLADAYKEA